MPLPGLKFVNRASGLISTWLRKLRGFKKLTVVDKAKVERRPSFYWKINAGRITKGQNSREIEVSATGANGFENITATVDIAGFDPSCPTIVSCTTKIIW